jgi:hypothetical protein
MYLIVAQVDVGGRLVTLVAQVATGGLVYGAALVAVDQDSRRQARKLLERLKELKDRSGTHPRRPS